MLYKDKKLRKPSGKVLLKLAQNLHLGIHHEIVDVFSTTESEENVDKEAAV